MCVDYDELEIARWLIGRGMDVNVRAAVDADGFGGHTALSSVHGEIFGEIRPASTMVIVAGLIDPRWKVEVELDAVVVE